MKYVNTFRLESVTTELGNLKIEANELCLENDFLQQETQQTKVETQEYMNYMSKKTGKRQNAVITFSDRNKEQIGEIESRKLYMMDKFHKQKTGFYWFIYALCGSTLSA